MQDIITDRLDLYLAKVAGREVDIKTMTPPVAASMMEKLLLEIDKRIEDAEKAAGTAPDAATTEKAGVVKMAANVPEAADTAPTAAEFKALLDALIAAGIMAAPAANNG